MTGSSTRGTRTTAATARRIVGLDWAYTNNHYLRNLYTYGDIESTARWIHKQSEHWCAHFDIATMGTTRVS